MIVNVSTNNSNSIYCHSTPSSETASFDSLVSANSLKPLTYLPFTEFLSMGTLASSVNPDHEEFQFWWDIDQRLNEIKQMPCNKKIFQ